MDLDTTGQFRCEISGEAPLFQTAYREAVMAVVGKLNLSKRYWTLVSFFYELTFLDFIFYLVFNTQTHKGIHFISEMAEGFHLMF